MADTKTTDAKDETHAPDQEQQEQEAIKQGQAPTEAPVERNTLKYPRRLLSAESQVMTWHHTTEFGVTVEEVLLPEYWAGVAKTLRPGHEIVVNSADMSWYARLLVRAVGRSEAHVSRIMFVEFTTKAKANTSSDFKIEWMGPTKKYGVIRKSDLAPIKDGFAEEGDAQTWIKSHEAALAA